MSKQNNIVHQYFKKEIDGTKVLVKVNPIHYKGTEITIFPDGNSAQRELEFDSEIFDDLNADGFEIGNPMEFNLYLSGVAK
ncbi:MAG: hypothetical protein JJE09_00865 [Bacteroidia bacterium]|nr:hypothetical protein [Bacteroidia bacterium]